MNKEILRSMLSLMREAGTFTKMDGKVKKEYVMMKIKKIITLDNEAEEFILFLIDIIIEVDNGKLIINPKFKNILCC